MKVTLSTLFLVATAIAAAQYAPPAGQPGTTAVHRDSLLIKSWASGCMVTRGPQDISDQQLGPASAGTDAQGTGKSDGSTVSLGDGGIAVCTFAKPIVNGPGPDFVVFENGITDSFLELAFVEVSSDGTQFTRFRSHSLSDTVNQKGGFDPTDAQKINNLAGKYRAGFGTPFDLQELAGMAGLDISAITHVKIVDVVGALSAPYASRDGYGNKVNDPWPTPFPSSGFDLDAVGVVHESGITSIPANFSGRSAGIRKNPVLAGETVCFEGPVRSVFCHDSSGLLVATSNGGCFSTAGFLPGIYVLRMAGPSGFSSYRLLVL